MIESDRDFMIFSWSKIGPVAESYLIETEVTLRDLLCRTFSERRTMQNIIIATTHIHGNENAFFLNFSCPVDSRRCPKDGSNLKNINAIMKTDVLPKILPSWYYWELKFEIFCWNEDVPITHALQSFVIHQRLHLLRCTYSSLLLLFRIILL
jgi:hypothetical protein